MPPILRATTLNVTADVSPAQLSPLVQVLSGSPVLEWLWRIESSPLALQDTEGGANGDFTDGSSSSAAPTLFCFLPGAYALQVNARDTTGWCAPISVTLHALVGTIGEVPGGADAALTTAQAAQTAAGVAQATANGAVAANAALAAHAVSTTLPLTGGGTVATMGPLACIQATAGTDGYVTAAKHNAWDDKMDNPMTVMGDMIYGGAGMPATPTRLNVGAATEVLHGGATPSFGQVVEADLDLSDNVTANATAVQHGFAPRLSGAAGEYLNGAGAWTTPAGVTSAYTTVATNVGGGGGNVNVVHNFGAYPLVQVLIGGVVTPPGVGTVTSITHNTVNDFTVAYSGAAVGHILASLGSPQAQLVVATGVNRNVLVTDYYIKATAAGILLHLPTAVGNAGRTFVCDNGAIGNITVDCIVGGQTIEGEASQEVPPDCAMAVYSDGANWRIA